MLLTTLKIDSLEVKKVQMKLRTAEGQQGSLNAFIVEKQAVGAAPAQPPMCAMLEIPLKPLNLHERIQVLPAQELE